MTRTRVRQRRRIAAAFLCVALASVVGAPMAGALARHAGSPDVRIRPARSWEEVYVVRPGDTLWSIAERRAAGRDPRVLVDAIAVRNHIDAGALVPGQAVIVPRVA